jgi:hypothetical protein
VNYLEASFAAAGTFDVACNPSTGVPDVYAIAVHLAVDVPAVGVSAFASAVACDLIFLAFLLIFFVSVIAGVVCRFCYCWRHRCSLIFFAVAITYVIYL